MRIASYAPAERPICIGSLPTLRNCFTAHAIISFGLKIRGFTILHFPGLIIGIRLFFWGSQLTSQAMHCGKCGYRGPFTLKKGMRFVTVFFIIPVIPISSVMQVAECKQCKTRYQAKVSQPGLQQAEGAR